MWQPLAPPPRHHIFHSLPEIAADAVISVWALPAIVTVQWAGILYIPRFYVLGITPSIRYYRPEHDANSAILHLFGFQLVTGNNEKWISENTQAIILV